MDTCKIKKRYCTKDKVQIMLSNASNQIICSNEGYLYLRDGDISIHKYLSDPQKKYMPYSYNPSSNKHANHLFNYNKIYAKFTRSRIMGDSFGITEDSYTLSFLYFYKIVKGDAVCAELYLDDFTKDDETVSMFTKKQLEIFLYSTFDIKGKYIFDWFHGIIYANSTYEMVSIKKKFIDLSDNGIIELYNRAKEPIKVFNYYNKDISIVSKNKNDFWKAHSIDEVAEFSMTNYGLNFHYPIMLVITDTEIYASEFEVIFCEKDCFKVRSQKIKITPNLIKLVISAINSDYPSEPHFFK